MLLAGSKSVEVQQREEWKPLHVVGPGFIPGPGGLFKNSVGRN